jgi:ATP-binding cassette subfamily B protein
MLAGILIISLIISGVGIMGAFVFEIVIDNFTVQVSYDETDGQEVDDNNTDENMTEDTSETIMLGGDTISFHIIFIALIVMYLLQSGIQYVRGYLLASMSRKIDVQLSLSYYNHIIDLPVSSVSMYQTGEYMSRFSDASTIRQAISGATITMLLDSVLVIVCGIILFLENSKLFWVSLLMILLDASIILIYRKPVEKNNRKVMEEQARLQSYFKESVDGIETVKAACADQQVKQTTTSKFKKFINAVFKIGLISNSQEAVADMIEMVGIVIILWIGFSMVLSGQITIGSLITFYALLSYFTEPIKNLIELQPTIQTAIVAAERLNDILDLKRENLEESKEGLPIIRTWELKNLDFRYGNRELALEDVSFSVRRGERVAIVGESGSGKTTLAKLLLRFYEAERGEILLNGIDIKNYNLYTLRKEIAYVDQNTFLFSDTIKNNLKLGNEGVTDDEIKKACSISCADEFINKLPLGYDTPLDENAKNLSGGQRQRLVIARALLKNPQLLIFDEATSNLDTITEASIKDTISKLDENITCIIIAHRMTTIKGCDRIYVMEQGKIVESGTHDELMKKGGKYMALWNGQ